VGEILIRLRRQRGLSQEDFARELGISASYLSLLENGKRPATKRVVRSLATYLHVPAGFIVLQDLRLEELSERHRGVVKELRRELMTPALQSLFAENRDRPVALDASDFGMGENRPH
jgi:transcriptional regulator with XRE-family HTH domain